MAQKKFFYKVLIVLSAVAVFLAACGSAGSENADYQAGYAAAIAEFAPGNPGYDSIYDQGAADAQAKMVLNQTTCQPFINQATCQPFVDTALVSVVYDAVSCSAPIADAQATWRQGLGVSCQQEGYKILNHSSALDFLQNEGYRCYIPVILPTPKPEKPEKPEKPDKPVEPPCVTCPVPPVEPPPCATCPVPPGD